MPKVDDVEDASVTKLVARFSAALHDKLLASERKYGWNNAWAKSDWQGALATEIARHIEKGDPIDVAAYCAFAWHHGWSLSRPPTDPRVEELVEAAEEALEMLIYIFETSDDEHYSRKAKEPVYKLDTALAAFGGEAE